MAYKPKGKIRSKPKTKPEEQPLYDDEGNDAYKLPLKIYVKQAISYGLWRRL